jgi:hypothetical protein
MLNPAHLVIGHSYCKLHCHLQNGYYDCNVVFLIPYVKNESNIGYLGSGIWDLGSGTWDLGSGFRDQGSGVGGQGSGTRDQGLKDSDPS